MHREMDDPIVAEVRAPLKSGVAEGVARDDLHAGRTVGLEDRARELAPSPRSDCANWLAEACSRDRPPRELGLPRPRTAAFSGRDLDIPCGPRMAARFAVARRSGGLPKY